VNIDYLASNATNKYPFKDNATLKSVEGSYLPDDVFLDVQITAKKSPIVGAHLESIFANLGESKFTIVFNYFDKDYNGQGFIVIEIPYVSFVEKKFYSTSNGDVMLKVILGAGATAMIPTNITYTYTDQTVSELEQSAIITFVPEVTSVSFVNWNKLTNEASSSALAVINDDLVIEGRANVSFADGVQMDVIRGRGTGLYDGCGSSESVIRTINDTGPDSYHNLLFTTDDCYVTTDVDHGLILNNHCTPKCTTEQIQGYAYYLNRVNDGMTWVQDYAMALASSVNAQVTDFTTNVLPNRNKPYYKVKFEKLHTIDTGRFYYSFSTAFFNPSSTAKTLSLAITTTGGLISSSLRYRIDSSTVLPSSPTFSVTVPCLKTCFVEFVVAAVPTKTATLTGTFGTLVVNSITSLT
jgi:hypothetical protein